MIKSGAPPVAVLSYRVWESKYGSDPSVVGANFEINGHAFTIIGVTPPGFYGAKLNGWGMPDIWLPITSEFVLATMWRGPSEPTKTILTCWAECDPESIRKHSRPSSAWSSTAGWRAM